MTLALLLLTTLLYAGYNILIKVSGGLVPETAGTTISATILLQIAALCASAVFATTQASAGVAIWTLPKAAYLWAIGAGLCIGAAEIAYFYLFSGIGLARPVDAHVAIPTIVGGTVLIAVLAAWLFFNERLSAIQVGGALLIVVGLVLLNVRQTPTAA